MRFSLNLLILILGFFCVFSCKDDGNIIDDLGIKRGTIVAKLDGEQFKSTTAKGSINTIVLLDIFLIAGAEKSTGVDTATLLLWFNILPIGKKIEEKEYNFVDCDQVADMICGSVSYGFTDHSVRAGLSHTSGKKHGFSNINFTSLKYSDGGYAIGTFSGKIINDNGETIMVTDGKFNVDIK